MRLLLVSDYFPPVAPGGAEWSIYYLAEALSERGHEVALATVRHGPSPKAPSKVKIYAMPFPFHLKQGQTIHRQGILENALFHAAFTLFLGGVARRFRPDVIHAQSKNSLVASTLISKIFGMPAVYTLRDIGITCPYGMCFINGHDVEKCSFATCLGSCSEYLSEHYSPRRFWDPIKIKLLALALYPDTLIKQACLRRISARISPSRGLVNALPSYFREPIVSWTIIPHLPPSRSEEPPTVSGTRNAVPAGNGNPYVLFLGKMSLGKGIYVLEQAIRKVAQERPQLTFVVAGKGTWIPPKDLPVRSLGTVDHDEALQLMHHSTCVVVPSLVPEAFNRVVLEAMNLGRPVITSDAGSLPEQVQDNETGLVVQKGSVDALAQAILKLISNPVLAARYGENARQRSLSAYSPGDILERTEKLYSSLDAAEGTSRWKLLNVPIRLWLTSLVAFNDRAKRLAMHFVYWTGKSRQKIHPKNLMEKEDSFAWYRTFLGPHDRVLDVGSGHGTHTLVAATCAQEAVGVEYDERNLAIARSRANERRLTNIRFDAGNVEEHLPFEDRTFDTVLFLDVIEHLNKRDQVLGEIARVLRPRGKLLVAMPNRETSWKRRLKHAGLFYYSDRDHKIEYSLPEARYELERNGFVIDEPVQTIVYDTPWVGVIDLIGGISLRLYKKLMRWKVQYAADHPEESIGFQIVCHKSL